MVRAMIVDGHPVHMNDFSVLDRLANNRVLAVDTETTGLSPWRDRVALVQLYGDDTGDLALFQVGAGFDDRLREFLGGFGGTILAHNWVGFDAFMLRAQGVEPRADIFDTLVAETVLKTSGRRDISVSLRAALKRRLGQEVDKDIAHGGWGNEELTEEQVVYATRDVLSIPALMREQQAKAEERGMAEAMQLEMDIVPVVCHMTWNGMPFNAPAWRGYFDRSEEEEERLERQLNDLTEGRVKNWASHVQVKKMFADLGHPMRNTRKETLQQVAMYERGLIPGICERLLELRAVKKFRSSFSEKWVDEHVVDGVVHPKFWQCSTDTTRFSSSGPNMQQVPKKRRDVYGHEEGSPWRVLAEDYTQIEVVIAAALANDGAMLEALESGDVHAAVASMTTGIKQGDVSPDSRQMAKAQTFRLLFGGGAGALKEALLLMGFEQQAKASKTIVKNFFATFRGLARTRAVAYAIADKPGPAVIRLPMGYKRVLVGPTKKATIILNTTVQGTAAVGLKVALRKMRGRADLMRAIAAVVHDEVVFPWLLADEAEDARQDVERYMVEGMGEVVDGPVRAHGTIDLVWRA